MFFLKLTMDKVSPPQTNTKDQSENEQEDVAVAHDDYLRNLKALTEKLRLEVRKPSYLEWRAQLEAKSTKSLKGQEEQAGPKDKTLSSLRWPRWPHYGSAVIQDGSLASGGLRGFGSIEEALIWVKKELVRNSQYLQFFSDLDNRLEVVLLETIICFSCLH